MNERSIKRMRWRAFFFLRGAKDDDAEEENYGFKSRKCASHVEELKLFEDDLLKLMQHAIQEDNASRPKREY